MASFNKFNKFLVHLGGEMNLNTDILGVALTDVLPEKENEFLADITEIPAGNGYLAGGPSLTILAWDATDVAGQAELVNTSTIITAGGGPIGPFHYAVLYNKTVAQGPLIGWYDYGYSRLIKDQEEIKIIFDDGTGLGTLTVGP